MRAAELMVREATRLYEAGLDCGAEANVSKMLAADASWEAANACLQTHGGFGIAEEYDVERKIARDEAVSGRADFDQSCPLVCRRACVEHAAIILMPTCRPIIVVVHSAVATKVQRI